MGIRNPFESRKMTVAILAVVSIIAARLLGVEPEFAIPLCTTIGKLAGLIIICTTAEDMVAKWKNSATALSKLGE